MGKIGKAFFCFFLFEIILVVFFGIGLARGQETISLGAAIYGLILAGGYLMRPASRIHGRTMDDLTWTDRLLLAGLFIVLAACCVLPMSLSPHWNGTIPSEVNAYEQMTESILNGRIDLDIPVDPKLLTMENPYSWGDRAALGVEYAWDRAFYNGKYYLYFGIVPVFLIFLPAYFLTGQIIPSYQATQIIAVFTLAGIFVLISSLSRAFFSKLRLTAYACLCTGFSAILLWYAVSAPALYCTATLSGVCLMIWSICFFIRAAYIEKQDRMQILWLCAGALCGALVAGCRPPIATANLLLFPALFTILKRKPADFLRSIKFLPVLLPYIIIALLLMAYNQARFDSPFEFGQSYQLTLADQHTYQNFFSVFSIERLIEGLKESFIKVSPLKDTFPYIRYSGLFICYPVFIWCFSLFLKPAREGIRLYHLLGFVLVTALLPVVIICMDILWSPFLLERYKMDFAFLPVILAVLGIGFTMETASNKKAGLICAGIYWLSVLAILVSFLLFLIPIDYNYAFYYPQETADLFDSILCFWRHL